MKRPIIESLTAVICIALAAVLAFATWAAGVWRYG